MKNEKSINQLSAMLAELLIQERITISLAESVTGGLVSSSLVANPGISNSMKSFTIWKDAEKKFDVWQ